MTQYKKVVTDFGQEFIVCSNADDSETWIPSDPANSDYQAYLETLASESANDTAGNK